MKNLAVVAALFLCGCSVMMAAKKEGADFDDVSKCETRTCLIALGADPVETINPQQGRELFKLQKPRGSTTRAVMHGLLDVATIGIWEIVGTPVEGAIDRTKYWAFMAEYRDDGEAIQRISVVK